MDFSLHPDQIALRQAIRELAEKEIRPHIQAWDEAQAWPASALEALAAMGCMGILLPPEWGGAGMSCLDYVLILEELARVDPSVALIVAAHNSLCSQHIFLAGNAEQKQRWLPRLASGEWIGCWSLTEPQAGSDAGGTRSRAVRRGADWVLNGGKTFTTNGGHAQLCVAMALTAEGRGKHGISAFAIEQGTPGFRVGRKENKLGMRASDTVEVIFEDCQLPGGALLGVEGEGFIDALRVLDGGRIGIAALSVGLAQGAYEAARGYARERRQFGRAIAEFQAIQWKLADLATEIEAARWLTWHAAWRKDQGLPVTRHSAFAKLAASETAVRAGNECVQIFGGYGFVKDYPAEKFYRDAKLCTLGEGTSEIQRLIIAREILKETAV